MLIALAMAALLVVRAPVGAAQAAQPQQTERCITSPTEYLARWNNQNATQARTICTSDDIMYRIGDSWLDESFQEAVESFVNGLSESTVTFWATKVCFGTLL